MYLPWRKLKDISDSDCKTLHVTRDITGVQIFFRRYYTPTQKLTCFVLCLKIINTFFFKK